MVRRRLRHVMGRRIHKLHSLAKDSSLKTLEERPESSTGTHSGEPIEAIQRTWADCDDLQVQQLDVQGREIYVIWLRALAEGEAIRLGIIEPLVQFDASDLTTASVASELNAVPARIESNVSRMNQAIADGNTVLVVKGNEDGIIANTAQPPSLNVERPQNEPSVSGPQEAFVGTLNTDIAMIRKRLRDPSLKVESHRFGTRTHTCVALLYFDGIVDPSYIDTTKERLSRVGLDSILSANYIREIIRDHRYSLFPTMDVTERPDKVVAALVEGRFAILVDGSPQSILAPTTFLSLLTSGEDYYQNYAISALMRTLRQVAFWTALLLPSFYIAVMSYNQDLIPTPLLINVAKQHAGIPLPTVLEMFLMVFAFEVLREAGIRLPKAVGQSVSIVGALVIGEASVNAGVVSSGAVIIVAVSGVASFTIPSVELLNTVRILQFMFMLSASMLGVYGVVIAGMCLVLYMVCIDSLGVPYMTPYAPMNLGDMKDAVIRVPWWAMKGRPQELHPADTSRNQTQPPPK